MDQPTSFAVTFDYLCPFARNAHEHILAGLATGADWDVSFLPFSLMQNHTEAGQPAVYTDLEAKGILALQASIVVRDRYPELFRSTHRALFAARHDHGHDLSNPAVVTAVLEAQGVPAGAVLAEIESGKPATELQRSHEAALAQEVFGVPTFLINDDAVFVRVMTRPTPAIDSTATVTRILELITAEPWLNEFKHTRIAR
jgi:predicted DsbA family dithiol-disulfide isomerase